MDNVKKIILEDEDGTTREITKGFVCEINDDKTSGEITTTFNLCDISGKELATIVYAVLGLGDKLGLFNEEVTENE